MGDTTSEIELLRRSIAGSTEAFGAVVRRYQALVCAVTYSATGDVGTSEELAQETFIRVWKNLKQLENPGRFRAWLCTIARNLANTSLRGRQRDAAHPLESAAGLPASGPGPDEAAVAKERQEIVWAAVERVPLEYREPLVLFYRRQQSVREVAADLGLSEDAVRQRLHRGRQLIKAEVSSLVEETLGRSGPGKTFAVAVVAALPAIAASTASAAVAGAVAEGAPAAKTLVGTVLVGAILGPVLGLLGGTLGAWLSTRFGGSPRERRFTYRVSLIWWLLFLALIGLPPMLELAGLVPTWVLGPCAAAFFILLLALILWGIAGQRRIQIEEGTYHGREHWTARVTREKLYTCFGFGIGGGCGPFLYEAWVARDWVSVGAIIACGTFVFVAATRFWRRTFQC